jgi:protein-tyrosine-phosphatase
MALILFVCTGNVCRSPMAAGLLQQRVEARTRVRSAGLWASDGQPASENALAVMAERGIDLSYHRAHNLTTDDVAEADLILAMTNEHARLIRHTWSQYAWKVYLLSEMVGKRRDVEDPYGGSIEEYRACADTLSQYIDKGLPRILELA